MAKKRKRKRARRKSHTTKTRVRRKRRRLANPKRRRHVRRHRRNPTRRRRSHAARRVRRHRKNPIGAKKKRRHGRRRHRRNPGGMGGALMLFGIAIASFLAVQAGGYFSSKDGVTNAQRNRGILAVLLAAFGLFYIEKKKPGFGIAATIGGLLGAFGGWLTIKLFSALPAKASGGTSAVFQDNMSAVFQNDMSGYAQLSGYQQMGDIGDGMGGYQQLGAVYANDMAGLMPAAPWVTATPFDAQ